MGELTAAQLVVREHKNWGLFLKTKFEVGILETVMRPTVVNRRIGLFDTREEAEDAGRRALARASQGTEEK